MKWTSEALKQLFTRSIWIFPLKECCSCGCWERCAVFVIKLIDNSHQLGRCVCFACWKVGCWAAGVHLAWPCCSWWVCIYTAVTVLSRAHTACSPHGQTAPWRCLGNTRVSGPGVGWKEDQTFRGFRTGVFQPGPSRYQCLWTASGHCESLWPWQGGAPGEWVGEVSGADAGVRGVNVPSGSSA